MIVVRRPGADLLVLSVNVRQRVWTAGGIVTQLVTHPRPDRLLAVLPAGAGFLPGEITVKVEHPQRSEDVRP